MTSTAVKVHVAKMSPDERRDARAEIAHRARPARPAGRETAPQRDVSLRRNPWKSVALVAIALFAAFLLVGVALNGVGWLLASLGLSQWQFHAVSATTGADVPGVIVSVYDAADQLAERCTTNAFGVCALRVLFGDYHAAAVSADVNATRIPLSTDFTLNTLVVSPSFSTVIQPGSMTLPGTWVIFTDTISYFARNGTTGSIDFGGTNFTTVTQSALNAVVYGGVVTVRASSSKYTVCAKILIPSGVTFQGEGNAYYNANPVTTLARGSCWMGSMIAAKAEDAGGASRGIILRNFWISGGTTYGPTAPVVDFSKAPYAVVEYNYFYNAPAACLLAGQSEWTIYNRFAGCNDFAINLQGSSATDQWIAYNDISGAVANSNYLGDAAIFDSVGNNIIQNNMIYLSAYGHGILLYGNKGDQILGNTVHDNYRSGIQLSAGAASNVISGNLLTDNDQSGAGSYSGVYLVNGVNNTIVGNRMTNFEGSNHQQAGVNEQAPSDYNVIVGNAVGGNAFAGVVTTGNHTVVRSNMGFNPVGKIAAAFNVAAKQVFYVSSSSGAWANVSASVIYTVRGVDMFFTSTGGTGVSITIYDQSKNVIASSLSTLTAVLIPAGYMLNFGGFSGAPTVTVFGN